MNRVFARIKIGIVTVLLLILFAAHTEAFSLLGPYADWMQLTNGYRLPGDIGGPMDINEGYRWNVPVLTYSFDQSFLDYFGSNGVAAVEGAIKVLNDLPRASEIVLTNFPLLVARFNYAALGQHLFDLKSVTLTLLVEQMGLGPPGRNVFDLRRWDSIFLTAGDTSSWPEGTVPNLILERNFDPESLAPSHCVNSNCFVGVVWPLWFSPPPSWDVAEFLDDPYGVYYSAVADLRTTDWFWFGAPGGSFFGMVLPGLSRDDIGGPRYLLSRDTVSLETLLPGVHGIGPNAHRYVSLARRPGVEKVTFVRQNYDSLRGQFYVPWTNRFTDAYFTNRMSAHRPACRQETERGCGCACHTNDVLVTQQLERVITEPDFLFCVSELGQTNLLERGYARTGTGNWWNSAVATGSTNPGPGIIRPPIKIIFDKRGALVDTVDSYQGLYGLWESRWASFDNSTNPPVIYPQGPGFEGADHLKVRLWLYSNYSLIPEATLTWSVPVPFGAEATLQTSANLQDWVTVVTLLNYGGTLQWRHVRSSPQKFFRVLPGIH